MSHKLLKVHTPMFHCLPDDVYNGMPIRYMQQIRVNYCSSIESMFAHLGICGRSWSRFDMILISWLFPATLVHPCICQNRDGSFATFISLRSLQRWRMTAPSLGKRSNLNAITFPIIQLAVVYFCLNTADIRPTCPLDGMHMYFCVSTDRDCL